MSDNWQESWDRMEEAERRDIGEYRQQTLEEREDRRRERIRSRLPNIAEPCEECGGEGYGKVPPGYGFCGPECLRCLRTGLQP